MGKPDALRAMALKVRNAAGALYDLHKFPEANAMLKLYEFFREMALDGKADLRETWQR